MKTLQALGGREFKILTQPDPTPGPGEALVRVEAITTCPQWDLHLRHGEPMFVGHEFRFPYTPGQPGHEAAGTVTEIGEGVEALKPGDRVAVWRDPGHDVPGCYAQYVVRPEHDLIVIPDEIPFASAAPTELAMCLGATFLRLKDMNVLDGRRVGISGLGPAGLVAGQMARAEGASLVVGFDLSESRRERALTAGFDLALDPRSEEAERRFPSRPPTMGMPWNPGLEAGVDCVGAKASVESMMARVSETLALFGVQREEYAFAPRHWLSLCLVGYPPHRREAAEYAVGLIRRGALDLSVLVTHHMELEDYAQAIDLLEKQEAVKVCFHPWGLK
jgi:threonine dehydrogenase-like Zn-dependent dehydrogenase